MNAVNIHQWTIVTIQQWMMVQWITAHDTRLTV